MFINKWVSLPKGIVLCWCLVKEIHNSQTFLSDTYTVPPHPIKLAHIHLQWPHLSCSIFLKGMLTKQQTNTTTNQKQTTKNECCYHTFFLGWLCQLCSILPFGVLRAGFFSHFCFYHVLFLAVYPLLLACYSRSVSMMFSWLFQLFMYYF